MQNQTETNSNIQKYIFKSNFIPIRRQREHHDEENIIEKSNNLQKSDNFINKQKKILNNRSHMILEKRFCSGIEKPEKKVRFEDDNYIKEITEKEKEKKERKEYIQRYLDLWYI